MRVAGIVLAWLVGCATLACGPRGNVDRADPLSGQPGAGREAGVAAERPELRDSGVAPEAGAAADVSGGAADGATVSDSYPVEEDGGGGAPGPGVDAAPGAGPVQTPDAPAASPDASPIEPARPDARLPDMNAPPPVPVDAAVDTLAPGCAPGTCKRVFVTSSAPPNGALQSLGAADAVCQGLAVSAALGGSWKAWLSDANGSPATRFTRSALPYRLLDGNVVASNWLALTSGTLAHAIDVLETARPVPAGQTFEVWTGTTILGTSSGITCGNWTNNSAGLPNGGVGLTTRSDRGWTQAYAQFCDRTDIHVYCFEQ